MQAPGGKDEDCDGGLVHPRNTSCRRPFKNILTDGSSQLVHALLAHDLVDQLHLLVYPLTLGSGKRVLPNGVHATFGLVSATTYPTGVVGLHYARRLEQ
jgi:dihydrofolate reductase